MEKYKICPSCGNHVSPTVWECLSCGADLLYVPIVNKENEKLHDLRSEAVSSSKEAVRMCDCGVQNPASARKCISCGEDISDIQPCPAGNPCETNYILESVDGQYAFAVKEPICTIGREQAMQEYLGNKTFVSRCHAILTIAEGELFITNKSSSNGTYVNNERLKDDVPKLLTGGDEIGLGGVCMNGNRQQQAAYFIVRTS